MPLLPHPMEAKNPESTKYRYYQPISEKVNEAGQAHTCVEQLGTLKTHADVFVRILQKNVRLHPSYINILVAKNV